MSYWYLASPYSKYQEGLDAAHYDICVIAAAFLQARVPVFSPIAHSHMIAMRGRLDPLDHKLWLELDRPMMDAACGLIVAKLPGWERSKGVAFETSVFVKAGKPVIFYQPGDTIGDTFRTGFEKRAA